MKIIISPAKTIKISDDYAMDMSELIFKDKTKSLMSYIKSLTYEEAKDMWKCNDKLASLNFKRFGEMELNKNTAPALFAYEGLQYQYISAKTLTKDALLYLEKNLRILSAFYGILKPSTAICPYRLEMQANISYSGYTNLYDFWGDILVKELTKDGESIILNLASKEYSKCISKYQKENHIRLININFCDYQSGKLKQKATKAKMARGELVRTLAMQNIEEVEKLQNLKILDFEFCQEFSNENEYTYISKA